MYNIQKRNLKLIKQKPFTKKINEKYCARKSIFQHNFVIS